MELYTAGTGNGQRAVIAVNECGVSCKIHVLRALQAMRNPRGDERRGVERDAWYYNICITTP